VRHRFSNGLWLRSDRGLAARIDAGHADLDELTGGDDRRVFSIAVAGDAPAIASWRVAVPLPAGSYLFEGLALGEGIEATADETGSGAGLRISGEQRTGQVEGHGEWTPLAHRFTLPEPATVVLVADLRATAGRVIFNAESLALRRLTEP
jgi:hypothetical protein